MLKNSLTGRQGERRDSEAATRRECYRSKSIPREEDASALRTPVIWDSFAFSVLQSKHPPAPFYPVSPPLSKGRLRSPRKDLGRRGSNRPKPANERSRCGTPLRGSGNGRGGLPL